MAAIAVSSSLIAGLLLALCRISRFPLLRYPAAFFVEVIRALPVLLIIFFTSSAPPGRAGPGPLRRGGPWAGHLHQRDQRRDRAGGDHLHRARAARGGALAWPHLRPDHALRRPPPGPARIVLPQVGQIITLVKDTSLAAVIGVQELTRRAQIIYQAEFNPCSRCSSSPASTFSSTTPSPASPGAGIGGRRRRRAAGGRKGARRTLESQVEWGPSVA